MRQVLFFALAIAFPLVAAAEPLKQEPAVAAKTLTLHFVLNEVRSRSECAKTVNWRLELKDNTLSAFVGIEKKFNVPLAADGRFDHEYISKRIPLAVRQIHSFLRAHRSASA
jgi:hypothetical protein